MNNTPKIKQELIIKTCPNPQALAVDIATPRALDWFLNQAIKYTNDNCFTILLKRDVLPVRTTLLVSPCYDINEVKDFLENPQYDINEPLVLMQDLS